MSKNLIAYFLLGIFSFNLAAAQEADPFGDFLGEDDGFADPFASDDPFASEDPFGEDLFAAPSDSAPVDTGVNTGGNPPVENGFTDADPFAGINDSFSSVSSNLPSSATVNYSVVNMSMENADATQVGARAGDRLQFMFTLNSQTEDVTDFVPTFDVSGLVGKVEFTDLGFGQLSGNTITFPAYTNKAPCDTTFSFVVMVKRCEDIGENKNLSTSIEGINRSFAVSCGLTPTGPSQYIAFASVLAIMSLLILFFFTRRRV